MRNACAGRVALVTGASRGIGRAIAVRLAAETEAAAATESLVTYSQVPDEVTEPLDTMAQSALALCSGDPDELTGKIATMTAHRTGEAVVGEVRLRSATLDSQQDATRSS